MDDVSVVVDYARFAAQIRAVRRKRDVRVGIERRRKEEQPRHLALDDVLDLLHSETSRSWGDQLSSQLSLAVAESADKPVSPYAVGPHPCPLDDPFLEGMLDYYRHNFDTKLDSTKLAQAATSSFSRWTDDDGMIDVDRVSQKAGPTGGALLESLLEKRSRVQQRSPDGSSKDSGKYHGLSSIVASRIAFSKHRDGYLDRMPVVRELVDNLDQDLSNFGMASVQHLFPSSIALYESLFSLNLPPESTFIGGKYYSANVNTVAYMHARGMRVTMDATEISDGIVDAEEAVKASAKEQLAALFRGVDPKQKKGRQFLLLDDGGKLIQALHQHYPAYAHLCVAVEQTTRGLQVIEEMEKAGTPLACPVLNMAGCDLKRRFESPLIAESVAWHTDRTIEALGLPEMIKGEEGERKRIAVVVGFGATGAATAEALERRGYHVIVTDTDSTKLDEAAEAGYEALPKEAALKQAELLVGATGRGSMSPEDWSLLPDGAVCVNGASGNHELGVGQLSYRALDALDKERVRHEDGTITTQFGGRTLELGHENDDHRLTHRVVRTEEGKELLFVRGGSVINMEHDLPPEYRQIIVGMLVASCAQAATLDEPGLVDLDPKMQAFLLSRYRRVLKKANLPMDPPDLDALRLPFG